MSTCIAELEARLASVHPNSQLALTRAEENPLCLIYDLEWMSPALGKQEKRVVLHQLDFTAQADLALLFQRLELLGNGSLLGGAVVTGITVGLSVRQALLSRLHPGGSMFTEMLYVNEAGESSSPDDRVILEKLGKEFNIHDFGVSSMKAPFKPHRYLLTPTERN